MARGGGSSGVGGGETAFGQTFQFDTAVLLDKITFKTQVTQDVSGVPLLLWFGIGYTGQTNSGLSSLIIAPESDLPSGMGTNGDVWYLTLDIVDQLLVPNRTYAFMPRFASGGSGGIHPEMEVSFTGAYSYNGGAAFTFDGGFGYNTILNNEMVFFLHGALMAPLPGDFDGDVDGADFLVWQRGESPNSLSAEDLALWEAYFGTITQLSTSSAAAPEPATGFLLILGMAVLLIRNRKAVSKLNWS